MASKVLIAGGGKVGAYLATLLTEAGHQVMVVEVRDDHAADLAERLGPDAVVHGSATDATVLERGGVRAAQTVAAMTGADETNLVVSSLARFEFGVPRVIARVVDPRNVWMFEQDMGVDVALSEADLMARLVAEKVVPTT